MVFPFGRPLGVTECSSTQPESSACGLTSFPLVAAKVCSFILSDRQQLPIWWRPWGCDGIPSAFALSLPERQAKRTSQGQLERVELCPLGGCHPSQVL